MMQEERRRRLLSCQSGPVDVVLDTDAYNEIDDQFAISYLLLNQQKLRCKAILAAPFDNSRSNGAADGMEKSWQEIQRLLPLLGREDLANRVYRGSTRFLPDEHSAVDSPAVQALLALSRDYDVQRPLYIVAIGAITNIASAFLMDPALAQRTVVVWLGGHGWHMPDTREFNMRQDVAAARVVFQSGVPLVQLPCAGVVDHLTTTGPELSYWLSGKNALCEYLIRAVYEEAGRYAKGKPWSRVIWDVSAVAWLLNDHQRFMKCELQPAPLPGYDHHYDFSVSLPPVCYVTQIFRDAIFEDLFSTLAALQPDAEAAKSAAGG